MKLQFDFYEKEKFSITLEGKWKTFDQKHGELFIFTSYVLRQMWILDGHLTNDALAGAFICREYSYSGDILDFSDATILLGFRDAFIQKTLGSDDSLDKLTMAAGAKYSGNTSARGLNGVIFYKSPQIVKYTGNAKVQFVYYPELRKLDMKGLGLLGSILGKDVGYYGFWSTIELYKMLIQKNLSDKTFLNNLNKLAITCAYLQTQNQIPQNQTSAAEELVNNVISS